LKANKHVIINTHYLLFEFDEICWDLIVGVKRETEFKTKMNTNDKFFYVLI